MFNLIGIDVMFEGKLVYDISEPDYTLDLHLFFSCSHSCDLQTADDAERLESEMAQLNHPRLLLLDEPLSNLDTDLKSSLLSELDALQQKLRITTIHVTHDRFEAAAIAKRTVFMREGRIEQVNTAEILRG